MSFSGNNTRNPANIKDENNFRVITSILMEEGNNYNLEYRSIGVRENELKRPSN